jgi:hypothetical protein
MAQQKVVLNFGPGNCVAPIFIEITFADAEVVCTTDESAVERTIPDGNVEEVDVLHLAFPERTE